MTGSAHQQAGAACALDEPAASIRTGSEIRPVVLIVTYGFPPYIRSLGGAIRMLKLAQYLDAHGCEVRIVCAKGQLADTFGYEALLERLRIDYVDDPLARRASASFAPEAGAGQARRPGLAAQAKAMLKRFLLDVLTPDTGITVRAGMARAVAAVLAEHPRLTLITSGPPHSAHLLGLGAKRDFPGILWIVDYRDSWNGTPLFRKRMRLAQWLNRRYEAQVLARCDRFTFVSGPMLAKAGAPPGADLAAKGLLVMNGFDASVRSLVRSASAPAPAGPARIGYFGAISDAPGSYRDPTVLFEVLAGASEIEVVLELYGTIDIDPRWQARLGTRLLVGPQLSHAEAVQKMAQMDALMLLHTREEGAEEVVTGKVFEYIATGRPIISVGPPHMAVNQLLKGDPSATCVAHTDRAGLVAVLAAAAKHKAGAGAPVRSEERIAGFTREAQYRQLLALASTHAATAQVLP